MELSDDFADDSCLVQRFCIGDRNAANELFKRYAQSVFAAAYRVVGVLHDAQDVVQECWITAFTHAKSFDPLEWRTFKTWICTIARNKGRDHLRAQRRAKLHKDRIKRDSEPAQRWKNHDPWVQDAIGAPIDRGNLLADASGVASHEPTQRPPMPPFMVQWRRKAEVDWQEFHSNELLTDEDGRLEFRIVNESGISMTLLHAAVIDCLKALPPAELTAFVLWTQFREKTNTELAVIARSSLGAFKKALSKGRNKIEVTMGVKIARRNEMEISDDRI